jgi:hypothetical protein
MTRNFGSGLAAAGILSTVSVAFAQGCTLFVDQRDRAVARLAETGTVEARWEVREEQSKVTHTFVLVRSGERRVLWDVIRTDGYRSVNLEQAGGVGAGGCFLFRRGTMGVGPLWLTHDGRVVQTAARRSTSEQVTTTCAEYEGTPAAPLVARVVTRDAR